MQIINIFTDMTTIGNKWVVYKLFDSNQVLQHIGCCKIHNLFTISDAKKNVTFGRYFKAGQLHSLLVTDFVADKMTANKKVMERLAEYGQTPDMMKHSPQRATRIKCLDDGLIYATIAEAAQAYGAAISAISQHLRGMPGFKSIKGKRFARVYD